MQIQRAALLSMAFALCTAMSPMGHPAVTPGPSHSRCPKISEVAFLSPHLLTSRHLASNHAFPRTPRKSLLSRSRKKDRAGAGQGSEGRTQLRMSDDPWLLYDPWEWQMEQNRSGQSSSVFDSESGKKATYTVAAVRRALEERETGDIIQEWERERGSTACDRLTRSNTDMECGTTRKRRRRR